MSSPNFLLLSLLVHSSEMLSCICFLMLVDFHHLFLVLGPRIKGFFTSVQALLSGGSDNHGHSHDTEDENFMRLHDTFVWKSMIVIFGIYAFFLTERITIIGQNNASMRRLKRSEVRFYKSHTPLSLFELNWANLVILPLPFIYAPGIGSMCTWSILEIKITSRWNYWT